jgi:hypothetical protein
VRHRGQAVPEDEGEGQAVIETISNEDVRDILSMGRDMADLAGKAGRDKQNPGISRVEATVTAVNDDGSLTVNLGSSTRQILRTFKMTSACYGAQVGDRVIVDTLNHISYITGILARDNGHYVNVRQVFTVSVAFGSVAAGAFGEAHADIADHGCLSAPVVIPVSTGWVEAREATDIAPDGFTANCFNAGPGAHSGIARYMCMELCQ